MKTTLFILCAIIALLYIGGFSMSFSPFKISIPFWYKSVAIVLLVAAVALYTIGQYTEGYEKGLKRGQELVFEALEEVRKERNNESK